MAPCSSQDPKPGSWCSELSSPRQPLILHQNPITSRILLPKSTLPGVLWGCRSDWDQFPACFLPVFPRGGAEPALRHPPAVFLSLETPWRSSLWGWEENPAVGQGWEEENPALGLDWEENPALGSPERGMGAAGVCAEHSLGARPAWKPLQGDTRRAPSPNRTPRGTQEV